MTPPTHRETALESALGCLAARAPNAKPRIAVILGSGWSGLGSQMKESIRIPYADLPGFPRASVAGHAGELWIGRLGSNEVAVLAGRQHAYETGETAGMRIPLLALRQWGCDVLVQTNAAGSLRQDLPPGSLMLLSDHINFVQRSPLVGEAGAERFVDMVDAYDPALRAAALGQASTDGLSLGEGVYLWALGPQFETPAEIRMFGLLGADAVGMSTVPETILARHAGFRVLAISLITNMAAGLSTEALSHAHTLAQANASSELASGFLSRLIGGLP